MEYTEEQAKWLRKNIPGHSIMETVERFNRRFDNKTNYQSVRSWAKNHKVRCGVSAQFTKGFTPWNKGLKYTEEMKDAMPDSQKNTRFKKGHKNAKTAEVGAIRQKGDEWHIKIAQPNKWQLLSRYVWEQHHGKLKKNEVVIHLDKDINNNAIENLEKVTKAELVRLNYNYSHINNAELMKTAITVTRLNEVIFRKGNIHCYDCKYYEARNKGFICHDPHHKDEQKYDIANRCARYLKRGGDNEV